MSDNFGIDGVTAEPADENEWILATPRQIPIVKAILDERARQEVLQREGRFMFTAASTGLKHAERLPMLVGEIGEVATQVEQQPESGLMPTTHAGFFDHRRAGVRTPDGTEGTEAGLRRELVQVAAIAFAWIEAIDSGHAAPTRPTFKPQTAETAVGESEAA